MEAKYNKKLQTQLSYFEKYHNEWEWSDLISWLQSVDKLVVVQPATALQGEVLQDLTKRLSQCLNPSLPPGIHTKTLEIYRALLLTANSQDFHWLSSGLFPFFQHCSSQNKSQFLRLVKDVFLPRADSILNVLPGLIASLLSGAEDRPETFNAVKSLLEAFSGSFKPLVQHGVWQFVRGSSQYRSAGLKYMQTCIDVNLYQDLAVQSLLLCFKDQAVLVKRQALDLVKTHFALLQPQIRSKRKVKLMHGALKLLQSKDMTLMRRLWEWAFPHELEVAEYNEVVDIITRALKRLFREYYRLLTTAPNDQMKLGLIRVVDVLVENENIGVSILERIGIRYMQQVLACKLHVINNIEDQRAILMFYDERATIFWNALTLRVANSKSPDKYLDILTYAFSKIEINAEDLVALCSTLFTALRTDNTPLLEFCIQISPKLTMLPAAGGQALLRLMESLQLEEMPLLLRLAVLAGNLSHLGLECESLVGRIREVCSRSTETQISLMQLLVNLRSKDIAVSDLHFVWMLTDTMHKSTAYNLLWQIQPVAPGVWTRSLAVLLLANSLSDKQRHMKMFIRFWERTAKESPERLSACLQDGQCVFIMIDMLTDENPILRHTAREWLCSAKKAVNSVLDPILAILLHKFTRRQVHEGHCSYVQAFDTARTFEVIRKLKAVLDASPSLKLAMDKTALSTGAQALLIVHQMVFGTYLEIVLDTMLLYLNTSSPAQPQENELLQSAVCEVLEQLVQQLPCPLAFKALSGCSQSLESAVRSDNSVMQALLMRVIQQLLFACDIESVPESCMKAFQSEAFASALLKGLHSSDALLRKQWSGFIDEVTPFLIYFLKHPVLTHYIGSLIHCYTEVILQTEDLALFSGLRTLVHTALGILRPKTKSSLQFIAHSNVKAMVFKELETLFKLAIQMYLRLDPSLRRNTAYQNERIVEELICLFVPIAKEFTSDLIRAILDLWVIYCFDYTSNLTNMSTFMKILASLHLNLLVILDGTTDFLASVLKTEHSNGQELALSHFVYVLLSSFPDAQVPPNLFWQRIIRLFKLVHESLWEEANVLVLSIASILTELPLPAERKVRRELQEMLEAVVSKLCASALKVNRGAYHIPYPFLDHSSPQLHEVILAVLTHNGNEVLRRYLPERFNAISLDLLTTFRTAIPKATMGVIAASKLVLELLSKADVKTVASVRKETLDYIASPAFLKVSEEFPGSYSVWLQIVDLLAHSFPKKEKLLEDLLSRLESGFFTSSATAAYQLKSLLLLSCSVLLSGQMDDYIKSLTFMMDKLRAALNNVEFFPYVCVLLRVFLVRLNKHTLSAVWLKIWPDLHVAFVRFIANSTNFSLALAGLKLLDALIAVGFEDIYSALWVYFFDVAEIELEEGNNGFFLPLVIQHFICGFSARPVKLRRAQTDMKKKVTRTPLLTISSITSSEDLDRHVKTLLQFCMYYNSVLATCDWEAVDQSIIADLVRLSKQLNC